MLNAQPATNIEEFKLMNQHFVQAAQQAKIDYRNLKEFSENATNGEHNGLGLSIIKEICDASRI